MIFFTADEAKGNSQWDLQGPEGQLSTERWKTVSGLQAWYMMMGHMCKLKNNNNSNIDLWNVTSTNLPPSLPTEREQISLKVLQTLDNDKVQVSFYMNSTCCWQKKNNSWRQRCFFFALFSTAFRLSSTTGGVSSLALANCSSPTRSPSWWTTPRSNRDLITQRYEVTTHAAHASWRFLCSWLGSDDFGWRPEVRWWLELLSSRCLCEFSQRWNLCGAHAQRGQEAEGRLRHVCCARTWPRTPARKATKLICGPSGWRGAALRPRDRGGDQVGPDGLQSQLRQCQPGQVRPHCALHRDNQITKTKPNLSHLSHLAFAPPPPCRVAFDLPWHEPERESSTLSGEMN